MSFGFSAPLPSVLLSFQSVLDVSSHGCLSIKRNIKQRRENPDNERIQCESRLWWLLYTAPCLPIGLIIFAWTSIGPPQHWIGSMIASAIIGIANYAVYMAKIDYMICAYGPYSASATGGNGWARDFLAGVLTSPATPFYESKSPHRLPSLISNTTNSALRRYRI